MLETALFIKGYPVHYLSSHKVCIAILYFKGETTPHLSVLTAVQYQHPEQWQDDKASMLLMDGPNLVVVLKGLDFSRKSTVHCHTEKLISQMKCPQGDLSAFQPQPCRNLFIHDQTHKQHTMSEEGNSCASYNMDEPSHCVCVWTDVYIIQCTVHPKWLYLFVSKLLARFIDFTILYVKYCSCKIL